VALCCPGVGSTAFSACDFVVRIVLLGVCAGAKAAGLQVTSGPGLS